MGLTLLKGFVDHIVDGVQNIVGTILWGLCDVFFVIINICETLFRKFAGLDVTYSSGGEEIEGDIVLFLLQTETIQNVFFSVLILSFFLLIIFTIFAIVKNQYAEKPKPVMGIINNSVKGLLQYLMVPVCVVVGLAVGNVILQAVDGATKGEGDSISASEMVFKSAVYNANKVRNGNLEERREELVELIEEGKLESIYIINTDDYNDVKIGIVAILQTSANESALVKAANVATEPQLNQIASLIDEAFVNGALVNGNVEDIYNPVEVFEFYEALSISYITIWVGGAFLVWCLITITWGLLGRIFKMVISYVLTPALIAMYPMDEGKALKSWIGYFSKEATMAYCAVGVVNVFYSVLPLVKEIKFYGGLGFWDSIIQLLITISGYMLVKSFIGTVSGWFGTGDAMAAGGSAKADVGKGFKNVTGKLTGASTKTIGTFAGLKGGIKQAGDIGKSKFFGALTGAYKGAGLDAKFDPTKVGKAWKDGQKSGKEYYKQVKTTHLSERKTKENEALFEEADIKKKYKGTTVGGGDYVKALDTGDSTQKARRKFFAPYGEFSKPLIVRTENLAQEEERIKGVNEKLTPLINIMKEQKEKERLERIAATTTDPGKLADLQLDIAKSDEAIRDAINAHNDLISYDEKYKKWYNNNIKDRAGTTITNIQSNIAEFVAKTEEIQKQTNKASYELKKKQFELEQDKAELGQRRAKGQLSRTEREDLEVYKKSNPDKK